MKIKKIISRLKRNAIFLLDGVNTTLYMEKYNRWLKKEGMQISGNAKYINHTSFLDGTDYTRIHIGDNTVISLGCTILVHDFSVEVGLLSLGREKVEKSEGYALKDVYIGDNSFVGANCTILCGTKVGQYCVVGAGSVLPGKEYPDYSIIAGNPAKVIGNTKEWAQKKVNSGEINTGFFN